MIWLLALIGLFAGAFIGGVVAHGDPGWLGAAVGTALGVFAGHLQAQGQRLKELERALESLKAVAAAKASAEALQRQASARERSSAATASGASVSAAPAPAAASEPTAPQSPTPARGMVDTTAAAAVGLPDNLVFDIPELSAPALPARSAPMFEAREAAPAPVPSARVREPQPARPQEPDIGERVVAAVKHWFTEGNVPVKVGVLVLFLGVGALMKYAADQGWLRVPIELRLAGISAVALAGLVFAWRKRGSHRNFSLSLQGGAIGVLLLVVFGAFKLYHLIPATAAFVLLVVLVAGIGVLAVAQDAIALAVLGIVGGFLAPILTSTGSGNHVALFTYYAVLNAAILGIAWMKSWRVLNLIGFAFTFGIATLWGADRYRPELFSTTEPFLILFYAFYLLIPVLFAIRQPEERRGFVDGSLVFGTPLIAFPLQARLLDGDTQLLALSAMTLALAHVAVAWFARKRLAFTLLGQSHALLALGFATLAVPLALSARSTACAWAVEGAALVWLGLRQQRRTPRWIGCALQLAAGASLFVSGLDRAPLQGSMAVLNGDFLAIALLSAAGFISARLYSLHDASLQEPAKPMARLLFVWALLWWVGLGLNEIERFADVENRANWILGFVALSTWLAGELRRRMDWEDFHWPALLGFVAAPLLILPMHHVNDGPLGGYGALAWLAWFAASLRAQANLRAVDAPHLPFIHFVHTWTWAALFAAQAYQLTANSLALAPIWQTLAVLTPIAVAFAGTLARLAPMRLPLGDEAPEATRGALLMTLSGVLGVCWLFGLLAEGAPTPLSYVPVLNPLELAQVGFVLALLVWFRHANAEGTAHLDAATRAQVLALIGFALLTSITLRAVHFLGDVEWGDELLRSALAQACLSVVWCLAGLTGMLVGARRRSRPIWIGGAALVALVIAKLILVDRSHLSDLSAIFGVLAVGGLLMVVGWFAPNPPREAGQEGAP